MDENPVNVARAAFAQTMMSRDVTSMSQSLVSHSLNSADWRHLFDWCVKLSSDRDPDLEGLPYTCIGHLARLHDDFCTDEALEFLSRAFATDPEYAGIIEDAIDDVKQYRLRTDPDQ